MSQELNLALLAICAIAFGLAAYGMKRLERSTPMSAICMAVGVGAFIWAIDIAQELYGV